MSGTFDTEVVVPGPIAPGMVIDPVVLVPATTPDGCECGGVWVCPVCVRFERDLYRGALCTLLLIGLFGSLFGSQAHETPRERPDTEGGDLT